MNIEKIGENIMIVDRLKNKIWVFNTNYSLIGSLGGTGKGPGEYLSPPVIIEDENYLTQLGH
ncbi:MAG: 6-bladed beta-propeller [Melioribacteraceae bacterium]|nr:6-bladed beta-propeller [Melioribacteraceae bacterium]MCF8396498.1 6-bladed beta-propeller [Melioribacteraceae bacterium]